MAMERKCGQSGYITPAVSRVPNAHGGDENQKRLCNSKVSKMVTSPVPSRGSPTPMAATKIRNGYMERKRTNGCATQMWTRWLHHPCRPGGSQCLAWGEKAERTMQPKCGPSGYITTTALRVPNAWCGEKKRKWLCSPNVDKVATSPLPSRGFPMCSAGRKCRKGYATQIWTTWLHRQCRLGVPNARCREETEKSLCGANVDKVATSPPPR